MLECPLNFGDRRTAYLDTGVAPRVEIFFRLAHPLSADAQARDKSHLRVYRQHLAVISREPAKWTIEARRVVAADFDPALAQVIPELTRGLAEISHPVVNQLHAHAFPRSSNQCVGEHTSRVVLSDDVVLEVDSSPGGSNRLQPRRVVLVCIFQKVNAVTWNEQRTGSS